ncbi:MAG: nucleotidyltransferase domain-containing protein [Brevinematales bacterium]
MTEKDRKITLELKRELSNIVEIKEMRVFGSRAKGSHDRYSDLDVFLLVEKITPELKDKIKEIAWELSLKHSIYISLMVFTKDEVENSSLKFSPILRNINNQGIKI